MTRTTTRMALVGGAMALLLALTGCVGSFLPKPANATSTPVAENVAADLTPFYTQVLHWKSCETGGFQCATLNAPMDWTDPSKATIHLALIRKQATGTKLGSLLVNPGGPGGSGYSFIRDSLTYAVDSTLRANYDIVGFDPRGVNMSSAVKCYDDPKDFDNYLFSIPPDPVYSDAWIADNAASNKAFGQECLKYTGDLLQYITTDNAARDLDLMRATLGDTKLNYLGYSYGTLLGATYAGLYPTKTGHLVLDGAEDPKSTLDDITKAQAVGFENNFKAYLKDCLTSSKCPFTGMSVDQAMTTVKALMDKLNQSPLRASDGRELGSSVMFDAIALPLYDQSNWKYLNDLFSSVKTGDADYAFQLADAYFERNSDGTYIDNETEAFNAYTCNDYKTEDSIAEMRAQAAELAAVAPVFGPEMSYGGNSCADWPFPSTRVPTAIEAKGSAPIIVVGTTNDPATPYVWAQNLAKELQNGHLVTRKGNGHTGYNKGNTCVNSAVDNFFVHNTVPKTDPQC